MKMNGPCVDVAINVYGKPYQTAITLLTLMKHSGQWINKIYFVEEARQPEPSDFRFILDHFKDKIEYFRPSLWLWTREIKFPFLLKFRKFRHSIRYQYAWEKSDQNYLLIIHNDVYFQDDLIGKYLHEIGSASGIGRIGQCWGCPAYSANLCHPDIYTDFRPSYQELVELAGQYPQRRTHEYKRVVDKAAPWPLPECRLNEYVALVDLGKTKKDTFPIGRASVFGTYDRLDIGVKWFADLNNMGHHFRHFDYDLYATHSWVSLRNSGHEALFNKDLYRYEEDVARKVMHEEFGIMH
jgi:hypothetical protein